MISCKIPKQARSKRLGRKVKEDKISQLPDPLICQILSHLPIKDSVQTSVLSTRWKSLWLWLPSLEAKYGYFPSSGDFPNFHTFMSFGNKFFDSTRVSWLDKVKLRITDNAHDVEDGSFYTSCFTSWIDAAVKRKVQHLDIYCCQDEYIVIYEIPKSLYVCETLVSLNLHMVVLPNAEFVSLPCLKTMHLLYVWYPNATTFERLVSCSPVLEDLKIDGWGIDDSAVRVHSLSLKILKIKMRSNTYGVVIDAPLLSCLSIHDTDSESCIIKNIGPNAKLDIFLLFGLRVFDEARVSSRRSSIRSFLSGISNVRDMTICAKLLELICQYSRLEPLPQFSYMSHLFADIYKPDLTWILAFLGSCPNLESLILEWACDPKEMMNQMSSSYVPECLVSSLKYVDIKSNIAGFDAEMKLVSYFLENSVILKKLTLRLNYHTNVNVIFKRLLEIPRRSSTCQVVVVDTVGAERYNMMWSSFFPHRLCI